MAARIDLMLTDQDMPGYDRESSLWKSYASKRANRPVCWQPDIPIADNQAGESAMDLVETYRKAQLR